MRLLFLIIFVFIAQLFYPIYAQQDTISIDLKKASIKKLINKIEKNSDYRFIYNDNLLEKYDKTDYHYQNQTVNAILDDISFETDLYFKILENNLIVVNSFNTIKGIVRSAVDGDPLIGVNVIEKGTINGTITDINGNFTIVVNNKNSSLQFSFIGFETQEINIEGKTEIDVFLNEDVQKLKEIVVVGYGSQNKRVVTGSISSITSEKLEKIPVSSFDQALQGQLAGVLVSQNSNAPGGAVTIRIRGVNSTTGGNEPLYVIDGMPVSNENLRFQTESGGEISGTLSSLNPNDIESIEVLKDASAAAIYGTRAAGGVILITTKRGKAGLGKINFDAYYGLQKYTKKIQLTNAQQFIELQNEALLNGGFTINENFADPSIYTETTDWQEEIFQIAPIENYNISFSGGSEISQYHFSANYFDQQGIVIGSSFNRFSFRINTDNKITKKLKVGNSFTFGRSKDDFVHTNDIYHGVLNAALGFAPFSPVYESDGEYAEPGPYMYMYENPVAMALERDQYIITNKLLGNVYIEYEIIPELKYKATGGIDFSFTNQHDFRPINMSGLLARNSSLSEYRTELTNWLIDNILSYQKQINNIHNFSALIGASNEEFRSNTIIASAEIQRNDFPIYHEDFIDQNTISAAGLWSEPIGYISVFGRITYDYLKKYMLTANFRRDGVTKFGTNKKFGNFPSISIGWNFAKEPFMKNLQKYFNEAKIRLGYGYVGNSSIRDNQYVPTLAATSYSFNNSSNPGVYPASLPNPDLHWEASEQINTGIDLNLFGNKLLINSDYFIKNTKDMLIEVPVAGFLGIENNLTINAGELQNKGFEFEITYRDCIGSLKYEIGGNYANVKNVVTKLSSDERYISDAYTRTQVGQPVGAFYGYVVEKIFQTQEEIDSVNYISQETNELVYYQRKNTSPGDIKFKDIAGTDENGDVIMVPDGRITNADRTFIGNPFPDFTYGFSLCFDYKGIDLNINCEGVYGNDVINFTRIYAESMSTNSNYSLFVFENYWHGKGTSQTVPRPVATDPNRNARESDRWIENGTYFRINNIQLGYSLSYIMTDRLSINRFRIYITLKNFYTKTNYSGYDPDIGSYRRNVLQTGIDYGSYPLAKTIFFGINIEF